MSVTNRPWFSFTSASSCTHFFRGIDILDIYQDDICQATSISFHGYNVEMEDIMSEKKNAWCFLKDCFRRCDNHILIESLHFYTISVKRKRETEETFLLYDVY